MTDAPSPPPVFTPEQLVGGLVALLTVEELDVDLYRGARLPGGRGRVFGGQVIAQALRAAMRSAEGYAPHSLHAYFLRPGDDALPIIYRVERDFDGKSFVNRRVIALQRGQPILNIAASFSRPEEGFAHQADMPVVPPPEDLISDAELRRREKEVHGDAAPKWLTRQNPIEMRPVSPRSVVTPDVRAPYSALWFKTAAPVIGDDDVHRAILCFVTDMMLLGTSMLPHGASWITPGMQTASIDHAVWLHETPKVDDWLLYATDSPWAGHGRGFNRGSIYTREGRLIASVAQEGLIRKREPR
ncbi:acyl-CoA thioesterase II [soil metagenome]